MNKRLIKNLTIVAATAVLAACGSDNKGNGSISTPQGTGTVEYKLELIANWNRTDFPTNFSSNPHFSPVTGATHSNQTVIWRPNDQPTTPGIQLVAETGSPSVFKKEIESRITDGKAKTFFRAGGAFNSPGAQSIVFKTSEQFPLVSAISMIANSPDWFIGIRDVNLMEDGKWIDRKEFSLKLYDAGTDLGEFFDAGNQAGGDRIIKLLTTPADKTDFDQGVHRTTKATVARIVLTRQ